MMMVLVLMLLTLMSKEMIELLVKLMDADRPCWLPLVVILKGWECNDYIYVQYISFIIIYLDTYVILFVMMIMIFWWSWWCKCQITHIFQVRMQMQVKKKMYDDDGINLYPLAAKVKVMFSWSKGALPLDARACRYHGSHCHSFCGRHRPIRQWSWGIEQLW